MATPGIEHLRLAIASAYPGKKWQDKVKYMPDHQVVAIYNHFLRDGVFNKLRSGGKTNKKEMTYGPDCKQLTLWDFGIDPAGGGRSA